MKGIVREYNYHEGTEEWPTTVPLSMERVYVPLDILMAGMSSFTFENLEVILDNMKSRGNQALIRVYLDCPCFDAQAWPEDKDPNGDMQNGVPPFLEQPPYNLTYNTYTWNCGGKSPDYTNDYLFDALVSFIVAFGSRYDGDPRIAFIELELIGHWGEWHTAADKTWFPTAERQNRVLDAYETSFVKTLLLVRNAQDNNATRNIGYHDDSFCWDSLHYGDTTLNCVLL